MSETYKDQVQRLSAVNEGLMQLQKNLATTIGYLCAASQAVCRSATLMGQGETSVNSNKLQRLSRLVRKIESEVDFNRSGRPGGSPGTGGE